MPLNSWLFEAWILFSFEFAHSLLWAYIEINEHEKGALITRCSINCKNNDNNVTF